MKLVSIQKIVPGDLILCYVLVCHSFLDADKYAMVLNGNHYTFIRPPKIMSDSKNMLELVTSIKKIDNFDYFISTVNVPRAMTESDHVFQVYNR